MFNQLVDINELAVKPNFKLNFLKTNISPTEFHERYRQCMYRCQTILKNFIKALFDGFFPAPITDFFGSMFTRAQFIPMSFFNEYEMNSLKFDVMECMDPLNKAQKLLIVGFFFFEKVLLK